MLINHVIRSAAAFGGAPFRLNKCTLLLTVVASLVAWWNDNPVTQKALQNIEDIKQLRIDDEQRKQAVKEG